MFILIEYNVFTVMNQISEFDSNLWKNIIKTEIYPISQENGNNIDRQKHIVNFFTQETDFVVHEIYKEIWEYNDGEKKKKFTSMYCDSPLTGTFGSIYINSNKILSIKENLIPIEKKLDIKIDEEFINIFEDSIHQWRITSFHENNYNLPFTALVR